MLALGTPSSWFERLCAAIAATPLSSAMEGRQECEQEPAAANGLAATFSGPETKDEGRESSPGAKDVERSDQLQLSESPAELPPFDWDEFEARYEKSLEYTDTQEREIMKEAEALSKVTSPLWRIDLF